MRQGVNWSKMCDLAWAWEHRPHHVTHWMKRSYVVLKEALHYQFNQIRQAGVKVEWVETDPWQTSHGLFECIDKVGRLMVLKTDLSAFPDDHPLKLETDIYGLRDECWNDIFRAVHDYYGHYLPRQPFSPHGEEMACRYHALSLPSEAIPALINETRCQQAYMLYGVHARQKWQGVKKEGAWSSQAGTIDCWVPNGGLFHNVFMKAYPLRDRPFAPQKVVDLGDWLTSAFTY